MPREDAGDLAALREIEAELDTRWPETKIDPTLERIEALVDLLGNPQRGYPVVHIAGTNGKTSLARMIDMLLATIGLRTGRFISPHLQQVTERISLDGAPITTKGYLEAYRDIASYLPIVDDAHEVRLSKFEVLTAMAYAAFAETPVEAAVIEVGMGGRWDATNVVDAAVAVVAPIGIDHVEYLGSDIRGIAREKAGIIKPESIAVLAEQQPEVGEELLRRCGEVDATVARQGSEFGVLQREMGVGGQRLRLQGLGGEYDEVFLPLHGEHQARNAALALASVEAFFGAGKDHKLDMDSVRQAFGAVATPGRLEPVRSAPTVMVDAAHNPHGAQALAAAIGDEFAFRKLIGVLGVLGEKDAVGILTALEPVLSEVVLTSNSSPRAMDPEVLAEQARSVFGEERVTVWPRLDDAVEAAIGLAEEVSGPAEQMSGGGVLVTGSVVTAGEARALFGKEPA